jgi:mitochondrial import receptor subunit TOM40
LRIEDDDESGIPYPLRNKNPRRPPVFDALLNNIRGITKKVEHVKGISSSEIIRIQI